VNAVPSPSTIVATGLRKSFGEKVGVDFTYADLRGLHLDGAVFTSVRFDTLSARWPSRMDKLTHAGLKGMGADLSNVAVE
jgi:uncharacterized protein YjbI with pentapeptide repeats